MSRRKSLMPLRLMTILFVPLILLPLSSHAQIANDAATQQQILQALPESETPATASADQIAQAALDLVFELEGDRDAKVLQVMVSLEELTRAGTFANAPRFGVGNPPNRFYIKMLNLASSALDITYTTYHGVTVQHIMALTAAMRQGQDFVNGASSEYITR